MGCDIHPYAEYYDQEAGEWKLLPAPPTGWVTDDYIGEHRGPAYRYAWDMLHNTTREAEKLKEDPELAAAWFNLGLLHRDRDDAEAAREAFGRAAALPGPWQERARQALDDLATGA